ncbi:hypothetical protein [Syntrophobotulus glycolicus]|uniref:hypothetical protein n=1 Tax=Syntrophobotulus glycolicus TaxID=51197 RepID=UPI0011D178B0|nr:hypothetical protein [Syntrophobotulus glycolicus]
MTHFARQNELLFAKHITQKNGVEIRRGIARTERELEMLKWRATELSTLFKRLYEDNVLGKIPNEVFRKRRIKRQRQTANTHCLPIHTAHFTTV